MGDVRFTHTYEEIRDSPNRVGAIRRLSDEEVIAALGGASQASDPRLANVLATEAMNRVQRGKRVIANVSDGVVVLDHDGTITLLNPAAERVLGWLTQEVAGRHVREILVGSGTGIEVGRPVEIAMAPVRSGDSAEGEIVTLVLRDGSTLPTFIRSSPITVEGNVAGVVVLFPQLSLHRPVGAVEGTHTPAPRPLLTGSVGNRRGTPSNPSRPRIMIVEDESVVAMSLDDTLTKMGYDVVAVVPSGEAAVKIALGEHLDLILMDIMLQGKMDGVAAAEQIRASVEVPVIYLTAFSDEETLKRAKIAEPSGYLVKPYAERELRAAVEVALHNSALDRDRSRAKEALLSREKLLQEIVDNTPAVIYLKDTEGRYLLVNKQFEKACGVTRAQLNGKTDSVFLDPALAALFRANDEEVIHDGRAFEFEQSLSLSDGPHKYASLKFPLRDADGVISGVCGVSTDVTYQERTQQLALASEAQQSAYRELESFTRHVSHDLRAPARRIVTLAETLQQDHGERLSSREGEIVAQVRTESRRLAALITDLLEFIGSGAHEVHLQTINITAMAHAVAEEITQREPERHVEISIEDGVKGRGDPILLRLVMENLLENAWKYTSKNPQARLEFGTTTAEGGMTTYFVRDNGVGFAVADASRLFEPFQRLHSAADYPGTGLGLSSVRRIVERHGGKTWAEGAAGKGATFYFTLPRSR